MKLDCIVVDDDKISRLLLEKHIKKNKNINLVASYSSAVEATNNIKAIQDVDLIFLDVEMPDMSGIDFIKSFNKLPQVIIVSAKEHYAIDAIEYNVTDYILKPISYPRFIKALEKVTNRAKLEAMVDFNPNDGVFIRENATSYIRVKYADILWIEALENYVKIVTEKGSHTVHFTLKILEKKLPLGVFMRLHRSYIINIEKIDAISDSGVIINHNKKQKTFSVAKRYKEVLLNKLNIISK